METYRCQNRACDSSRPVRVIAKLKIASSTCSFRLLQYLFSESILYDVKYIVTEILFYAHEVESVLSRQVHVLYRPTSSSPLTRPSTVPLRV